MHKKKHPQKGKEKVSDNSGKPKKLKGMSYTSGKHLSLARSACKRAEENSSESIVGIIFSAMAIETFLNEVIEQGSGLQHIVTSKAEKERIQTMASVLGELEKQRVSVRVKIEMAHFILKGKSLDKGSLPYQDFALLTDLRNALIHKKPETFATALPLDLSVTIEPHPLVKSLADRKLIPLPPKRSAPQWETYISVPEVAVWAHNLAIDMVKLIVTLFRDAQLKHWLTLPVQQQIKNKIILS